MKIVKLRLYREEPTYNKEGELTSDHQNYKVSYGTFDWDEFKNNIGFSFVKAEILSVIEQIKTIEEEEKLGKKVPVAVFKYKDVEVSEEMVSEVAAIFTKPSTPMTAEQKEIAELKAQVAELAKGKKAKEPKVVDKKPTEKGNTDDADKLNTARARYTELFGKKPSHLAKLPGLLEKIAEKETENK